MSGPRASLRRRSLAPAVAVCLTLGACGGTGGGAAPTGGSAAGDASPAPTGDVVVLAAASLTEAFTAIADDVEAAHPGLTVTVSYGGSSGLAQQVLAGAPADVFAAASTATMAEVTDGGAADGTPTVFARNTLQIAVPPGNPGHVTGLSDLADEALTVALCAPQVPCGQAAAGLLAAAGVVAAPDTLESDVRAALTTVRLGEVDAALVYRTDVRAAGDAVEGIEVPGAGAAANDYAIVPLADAPHPAAARAFVDAVLADAGRDALAAAGFDVP